MLYLMLLLSLLGAPRFQTREAAQRVLHTHTNTYTLSTLEWAERHHPYLEGRRRCAWILDRHYESQAEKLSKQLGRLPWIDRSVDNYCAYLDRARENGAKTGDPDWPDWQEATRLWLIGKIAARQPYAETLRMLWMEEYRWRWKNQSAVFCW